MAMIISHTRNEVKCVKRAVKHKCYNSVSLYFRSKFRLMLQMSNLYRVQLILGKAKEQDMHAECAILYGKVNTEYFEPCCKNTRGAQWLSGRASESGARGRGFETYLCRVVSLSKTLYSPKVLVIPRKLWLHPNMTEKLLTGTLSLNTNKTKARKPIYGVSDINIVWQSKTFMYKTM